MATQSIQCSGRPISAFLFEFNYMQRPWTASVAASAHSGGRIFAEAAAHAAESGAEPSCPSHANDDRSGEPAAPERAR